MKGSLLLLVLAAAVGAVAACAAESANQSTHDGTTITLERPAGSTAPSSSAAPAPGK